MRRALPVCHVITGLGTGGAERSLVRIVTAASQPAIHTVISLKDEGTMGQELRNAGATVHSLGISGPIPGPLAWWRLRRLVLGSRPAVLHGWMYHGNLAAWSARPSGTPIVWGIRQSLGGGERPVTEAVIAIGASLSPRIEMITYNSQRSATQHRARGYRPPRERVIPNGVNTERFAPDRPARARVRAELRVEDAMPVLLTLARWHAMKGHAVLIEAFRVVAERFAQTTLVLAGPGMDAGNAELAAMLVRAGIGHRVRLLGDRRDAEAVLAAADLLVLPSVTSEGFPNVVAEAMATELPCVVTDVGDAPDVVGSVGLVVPPGDPQALQAGLDVLLRESSTQRAARGAAGRARVLERFTMANEASAYAALYAELAEGGP